MPMRMMLFFAAAALVIPVMGGDAAEAGSGPVRDAQTEVELIAEQATVQPGGRVTLGLRMKPDEGWHTYWVNPGGSGAPTELEWTLPEGFEADEPRWPVPERHAFFGITNYGYEREIVVLVTVEAPERIEGESVMFQLEAHWLTCEDVCIPGSADLELELAVSEGEPEPHGRWAELIERGRNELAAEPTGEVAAWRDGNQPRIAFRPGGEEPVENAYFFHAERGLVDYDAEQPVERHGGDYVVSLPLSRRNLDAGELPERISGVLVFEQGGEREAWAVDARLGADQPDMLTAALGGHDH